MDASLAGAYVEGFAPSYQAIFFNNK